MKNFIEMIAERKLSISFSKYTVQIIDPTNDNISYIEYHTTPTANAHLAFIHESREAALLKALQNCHDKIQPEHGIVMTSPSS